MAPVLRRGVAVLSAVVAIFLLVELRRVVAGLVVAGFFAAVLAPAVEVFERRVQLWRGLAVGVVVTLTTLVVLGVIVAIAVPLVRQASKRATNFSDYVNEAQQDRGPLRPARPTLPPRSMGARPPGGDPERHGPARSNSLRFIRAAGNVAISMLTICVLTVLILLHRAQIDATSDVVQPAEEHADGVSVGAICP